MSWNPGKYDIENPYDCPKYFSVLRQFCAAILGQIDVDDARGFINRAETGVIWAIECNDKGKPEQQKKRPRARFVLFEDPCGVQMTNYPPHVDKDGKPRHETHVEHPYTQQETEEILIQAYSLAKPRMLSGELSFEHAVHALMTIIDARGSTVLMPGQLQYSGPATVRGDGFKSRYAGWRVTDRAGMLIDFVEEDFRVETEVQNALRYLACGSGDHLWAWKKAQTDRSVAAMSNQGGPIAPAKTSNPATTPHKSLPQVRKEHLRAAMIKMGIDPDSPSNKGEKGLKNGFSYRPAAGGKVVMTNVKLDGGGGYATGKFSTIPGEPTIRSLSLEQFEEHVETVVQQTRRGVY